MSRVKIAIPERDPDFRVRIPVRISDLNYGKHLANDRLVAVLHEARVQHFVKHGCKDDLDFFGIGLIQADLAVAFRSEAFFNEMLEVSLFIEDHTPKSFAVYYQINEAGSGRLVATARTGMVAFDYGSRSVAAFPETVPAPFRLPR